VKRHIDTKYVDKTFRHFTIIQLHIMLVRS